MSDAQDRLRRLVNMREQRTRPTTTYNVADFDAEGNHISPTDVDFDVDFRAKPSEPKDVIAALQPLQKLVPGYEIVNAAGLCYCTEHAYQLEEARGPLPLGSLLELQPSLFHRYHPTFGVSEMADYRRAAFIDTETTGLGGGAGVYCFMVGVGTFEAYQPYSPDQLPGVPNPNAAATHFVVRQFFMRNPAEEASLLVALSQLLSSYEMTVTFNGRSFDLPLLRLRYAQNRRFLPLAGDTALLQPERPHLDLLMPARKIWKRRLQSCRLINLEQVILGLQRGEEDVPGMLIPEIYHQYVQSGYAETLRRVFYHNNEDIVTMVSLADHLSRAFGEGASSTHSAPTHNVGVALAATPSTVNRANSAPTVTGMDWAGVGNAHQRTGDFAQAEAAYLRALESVRNLPDRADIYRALGELYKRQKKWAQATETWQTWLTSIPGSDPMPYMELAKYYEWEARDLEQAEMWTAFALHTLKSAPASVRRPNDKRELEHRLARLQRKRANTAVPPSAE